jgi:hypothetical protein
LRHEGIEIGYGETNMPTNLVERYSPFRNQPPDEPNLGIQILGRLRHAQIPFDTLSTFLAVHAAVGIAEVSAIGPPSAAALACSYSARHLSRSETEPRSKN